MSKWITVFCLVVFGLRSSAQDTGWLVEQAPLVSMIMVRSVEKCPAFSARIEVTVSGFDPVPSTASGTVECQNGNIRWDVKLADIKAAQLSQNARAVVRQVNGDHFLLLTRPDQRANYLVLSGSHACLEQPLPPLKLTPRRSPPMTESLDGRKCARERFAVTGSSSSATEVTLWKAKELKGIPSQLQLTDSGENIQVRFKDVRLRPISAERFRVPQGLEKYHSVEDLVQSVLISKMKRRMGLE